ncbi:MAG: FkbM family methyltransferase [Oscillospiraceae bacterium]|nr:FkbM family methyltransferase [Oscillospiraceae bacterium]
MLSFIKETKSCWQVLKEETRPIYIYGMGNGAEKIMAVFNKYGIGVKGFFASDEFVRGHSFLGYKVKKYSEVCSEEEDFVIVLAFAAGYDSLIEKIENMATEHTLYAPDVPIEGGGLFTYEYCVEHANELEEVYNCLGDEVSRNVFTGIINFRISGNISYLKNITTSKNEVYENIIKPDGNETYVDLGAYNGDTVAEIISASGGKYGKIFAFEPDKRNYKKLVKSVEGMENIFTYNCAAWSCDTELIFADKSGRQSAVSITGKPKEARAVDSILCGERADIIKMDVEGAEEEAITGAVKTITQFKPKLMISLYHRNRDIFYLPLMIKRLNPEYRLFIRHQPYIPAWETNLYAI